jgi:hypothetical protein
MKKQKLQQNIIEQWAHLSPEEKKAKYLESIPEQVYASMAFEGEDVSLTMLKEHMKSLKSTTQPHALQGS